MKTGIIILTLISAPTVAWADAAYDQCMNGAITSVAMQDCGSAEVKRADTRLNAAWTRANVRLEAPSKAALLAEQRAWLVYRDRSCLFWSSGQFGTLGASVSSAQCRMSVVEARAAQLEGYAKDTRPQ